ncbi:MAG: hypothetical protein AB1861_27100 [Cyanobacteriota bacterium]
MAPNTHHLAAGVRGCGGAGVRGCRGASFYFNPIEVVENFCRVALANNPFSTSSNLYKIVGDTPHPQTLY